MTAQPLTPADVHQGQPCDCAEAIRRIERRERDDRRISFDAEKNQHRRIRGDRRRPDVLALDELAGEL